MGFNGSNDPTNSVKALKEVVVLMIRLQSHQVHLTMLQYYDISLQYAVIHKIHNRLHRNDNFDRNVPTLASCAFCGD